WLVVVVRAGAGRRRLRAAVRARPGRVGLLGRGSSRIHGPGDLLGGRGFRDRVADRWQGRDLTAHLLDHRCDRGQRGTLFVEHSLEGAPVPGRLDVGRDDVQELLDAVQGGPQVVVLAGLAGEEGAEVVGGRAHQALGWQQARVAVARADADDLDLTELAH